MLSLSDVIDAEARIADLVRHTPLDHSSTFSAMTGASVHLKLETFQKTGSFKIRGAANRIRMLSDAERRAGVVTASAGNHAQGVALAAAQSDVDASIVMPNHAAISKIEATRGYGAEVIRHGVDYSEAQARAHEIAREDGRTYVHAFDDDAVMAGQGTIGLEILDDRPDVETVVVPIGGGGLIGGVATALKGTNEDVRVVGVQAEGASSVVESLEKGEVYERDGVDTIADGIATRRVGDRTFEVIDARVDEVVTVTDSEIATALLYLLERGKTLVEGAGAVAPAALLAGAFDYDKGEIVVPLVSGGNIDLNVLTTVIVRGLVETGRYLKLRTVLVDRPGALETLAHVIASYDANINAIQHDRTSRNIAMSAAEVELDIETRGHDHVRELVEGLRDHGYDVEVLR